MSGKGSCALLVQKDGCWMGGVTVSTIQNRETEGERLKLRREIMLNQVRNSKSRNAVDEMGNQLERRKL